MSLHLGGPPKTGNEGAGHLWQATQHYHKKLEFPMREVWRSLKQRSSILIHERKLDRALHGLSEYIVRFHDTLLPYGSRNSSHSEPLSVRSQLEQASMDFYSKIKNLAQELTQHCENQRSLPSGVCHRYRAEIIDTLSELTSCVRQACSKIEEVKLLAHSRQSQHSANPTRDVLQPCMEKLQGFFSEEHYVIMQKKLHALQEALRQDAGEASGK